MSDWVPLKDWLAISTVADEILRDFKRRMIAIETRRIVEVIARKPRARRGRRRKK